MSQHDSLEDYYKVLQSNTMSSTEELKKSYQRLVLELHPDKCVNTLENFLLVQKAWSVLRDPESRRQYDATLASNEHCDILLFNTISLSDMIFDSKENVYLYSCRCGGTYVLEKSDSLPKIIVIGCDECSFSIQVTR